MLAPLQPATRFEQSGALTVLPPSSSGLAAADGNFRCARAYWPADSLDEFLLRMAAHGQCVSAAMMLGDRRYAAQQLERAQALAADAPLQALVAVLAPYFAGAPARRG